MEKRVWSSGENYSRFFRGTQKRGSEKYYIIISLILGLMVLALGLYFIFAEFFNQDEIDWEICRQSIILRAGLPNLKELGTDLKGAFPLKCKTEVVTIDTIEPEEVYRKISDAVVSGWYMFGEGKLDFIHRDWLSNNRYCMVFARIHFSSESVDKFNLALAKSSYPDSDRIQFTLDFYSYYLNTKIPGETGTYNKYLPMLGSGEPSPRFVWDSDVYPRDDDIALVYVMNKYASVSGVINYVPFIWISSKLLTGESLSSLLKKLEGANVVDMVSMNDLDKIGCTKFLTIPA